MSSRQETDCDSLFFQLRCAQPLKLFLSNHLLYLSSQWSLRYARTKISYQNIMATPVPAWKRLGLKLKYAQDKPLDTSMTNEAHTGLGQERPVKRQRLNLADSPNVEKSTNGTSKPSEASKQSGKAHSSSQAKESVPQLKRKKSVTFTNDTKDEDGDTRTTIDFPAGSPGSTPKKQATEVIDVASPSANSSVKNKVKKKSSAERKAARNALKDKSEPSLEYLSQHRTNRNAWKFNKNRDVWILSNALKTDSIPSSHSLALAGYVRGLPRNAGSRTRLVKECQEALKDAEIVNDETANQEFVDAVDNSSEMTITEAFSYSSTSRAQLLLWALDESIVQPTSMSVQIKKARKSRTAAPVDISSSESESDSDSYSDSSVEIQKQSTTSNTKDDASSSGSSNSESENNSSTDSSSSDSDSD